MAATNDRLKIGVIGAGGIVRQRHVPGLRQVPGVELAGVVNSTPESTARAAQEFGIPRQFESPEDLKTQIQVDVAAWHAHGSRGSAEGATQDRSI
jgi:predicted dehydrogenase